MNKIIVQTVKNISIRVSIQSRNSLIIQQNLNISGYSQRHIPMACGYSQKRRLRCLTFTNLIFYIDWKKGEASGRTCVVWHIAKENMMQC